MTQSRRDDSIADQRPPIVLTMADHDKLHALIREAPAFADPDATEFLREEVERADIATGEIAPTSVVRMGSKVQFIDHDDGWIHRAKLVFPDEGYEAGCVSILSSIGSALIGLGPGQSILWSEQGRKRRLSVLAVQDGEDMPPAAQGTKK
jgi:regulator of nucleoside diphosphate kinase